MQTSSNWQKKLADVLRNLRVQRQVAHGCSSRPMGKTRREDGVMLHWYAMYVNIVNSSPDQYSLQVDFFRSYLYDQRDGLTQILEIYPLKPKRGLSIVNTWPEHPSDAHHQLLHNAQYMLRKEITSPLQSSARKRKLLRNSFSEPMYPPLSEYAWITSDWCMYMIEVYDIFIPPSPSEGWRKIEISRGTLGRGVIAFLVVVSMNLRINPNVLLIPIVTLVTIHVDLPAFTHGRSIATLDLVCRSFHESVRGFLSALSAAIR